MSAYDKAVDLLKMREHTTKELETKLKAKGFASSDIDDAVSRLGEEGYLSDERFAEVYTRSRMRKSAEGKSLVVMRLTAKGVSKSLASSVVNTFWEEEEYLPSLKKEWSKLKNRYGVEKAEQKLLAKGFTLTEIRKAEENNEDE